MYVPKEVLHTSIAMVIICPKDPQEWNHNRVTDLQLDYLTCTPSPIPYPKVLSRPIRPDGPLPEAASDPAPRPVAPTPAGGLRPWQGGPGALRNGVDNVDEAEVRCWRDYSGPSSRGGGAGEACNTPQATPSPPEVIPLSLTLSGGGGDGRAFLGSSASEYLKMTQVQVWG